MQIEGIKDGLVVETCTVRKEMGQHSRVTLTAHLTDGKENFYLQQVGKPITIVQSLDLQKAGPVVFSGIVETVDIQQTFHQSVLCLCAVSSSHFLDQQEQCRIFQDSSKKMGDILDGERLALAKDMKSGDVKLQVAESLKKIPAAQTVIQNRESNFSFIRRCAAALQIPLWMQDRPQGVVLKMDWAWHKDPVPIKEEDILCWKTGVGLQKQKQLQVTLPRYLELGCTVALPSLKEKYVITALTAQYKGNRDLFTYELKEYQDTADIEKPDFTFETPLRLYGIVTNVEDPERLGRIQVRFKQNEPEYEDKDSQQMWIPYSSAYTGKADGIVFLPDPGNQVEVTFLHGQCYALSAHRNHPLGKEAGNVSDKFIGNDFQRRILWKKDSLTLLSGNNQIVMDDDKIELIVGKNRITIDGEKINLDVGSETIVQLDKQGMHAKGKQSEVHVTDRVQIESKGDIILDNNGTLSLQNNKESRISSRGKVQVEGSGNISLKSSGNVELSGSKIKMS